MLYKETKKVRSVPAPRAHQNWDHLEIHHDSERQQTEYWHRLPDTEDRTWGKPEKDRYRSIRISISIH